MMFFMLPAWGLSNAAATLVGQNIGAKETGRASRSVFLTAKYNAVYMGVIMVLTFLFAENIMQLFTNNPDVALIAKQAIYIMSTGYVFYGIGMVMVNAFNGAGDTRTPAWINFFGFWLFQIPLAYFLAKVLNMNETGVFIAVPVAETIVSIAGILLFRKGKWKKIKV